jgi:3-methylfumaryl-CoA hydratase
MTPQPAPLAAPREDVVARGPMERLAACAPLLAGLADGDTLPPLWHWLMFLDAAAAETLGADGHRLRGGMLAHDPALPSRMWAGGRLRLPRAARVGETLARDSAVCQTREREGRSGRLRFVTLRHVVRGADGPVVEEEQDLVFRAAARIPAPAAAPAPASAAPDGAARHRLVPDAVLLFRFSALTFNPHRIHYDRDYAREVEFYPDLVVHGPLQAILMAALLRRAAPAATLRAFAFRGHAPAFAGRALDVEAWPDPARPGAWHLRTRDAAGAVCMTAQAETEGPTMADPA